MGLFLLFRPPAEREFENSVEELERERFPVREDSAYVIGIRKDALDVSENLESPPKRDGKERSHDAGEENSEINENVDVGHSHTKKVRSSNFPPPLRRLRPFFLPERVRIRFSVWRGLHS